MLLVELFDLLASVDPAHGRGVYCRCNSRCKSRRAKLNHKPVKPDVLRVSGLSLLVMSVEVASIRALDACRDKRKSQNKRQDSF